VGPTQRAGFASYHLWVTRYDPAPRYPAGDFVDQHPGGAGLPAFTEDLCGRASARDFMVMTKRGTRSAVPVPCRPVAAALIGAARAGAVRRERRPARPADTADA